MLHVEIARGGDYRCMLYSSMELTTGAALVCMLRVVAFSFGNRVTERTTLTTLG